MESPFWLVEESIILFILFQALVSSRVGLAISITPSLFPTDFISVTDGFFSLLPPGGSWLAANSGSSWISLGNQPSQ